MRKFILGIGIVTVAVTSAMTVLAGELTVPNTFTSGTAISSSEMNANFDETEAQVTNNAVNITKNTADITEAQGRLTTLEGQASVLATGVSQNTTDLAGTVTRLDTVEAQVSTNTTSLGQNVTDIEAAALRLDALEAAQGSSSCPAGMVPVGPICVDKYEASIWDSAGSDTSGSQLNSTACSETGNDCKGVIFARSVAGVQPAGGLTWFQAQQACANAGKRLLTNAEWQMAAAGTVDPGTNDGLANMQCNTSGANTRNSGLAGVLSDPANGCISSWGVEDMVGNQWEWVADWAPGTGGVTASNATNSATYGQDLSVRVHSAATQASGQNFPAAVLRGGSIDGTGAGVFAYFLGFAPSATASGVGLRCAQ